VSVMGKKAKDPAKRAALVATFAGKRCPVIPGGHWKRFPWVRGRMEAQPKKKGILLGTIGDVDLSHCRVRGRD